MPRDSHQDSHEISDAEWERIARFTSGESDDAERESVKRWLSDRPTLAHDMSALDAVVERLGRSEAGDIDLEAALARSRAHHAPRVLELRPQLSDSRPKQQWGWRVAAAALLLAGVSVVSRRLSREEPDVSRVFRTAPGVVDTVALTDGSTVILAPASQLTIAAGYGQGKREVALDGLAYFDVAHDEEVPFAVRAGSTEIRDVGTSFTVQNDSATAVSVEVHTGVVEVRGRRLSEPLVLHDGDRVELSEQPRVVRSAAQETAPTWTGGALSFVDATIEEVAAQVRRFYGVELRFAPALASKRLKGDYKGLDELVQAMSIALEADAVREGNHVQLRPKGVASR